METESPWQSFSFNGIVIPELTTSPQQGILSGWFYTNPGTVSENNLDLNHLQYF